MKENEKPVVHVVFGMSAAFSLRQAVIQLGLDHTVIGLPDDLGLGPVNPPTFDLRNRWIEDIPGFDGFEEYGKSADLFWQQATDSGIAPIVWVCRRCVSEYCAFLEFLRRIGDQPFRVVDITNFEFTRSAEGSGPPTWITTTLGYIPSNTMIKEGLIDRQATLAVSEIEAYRGMWAKLRAEDAPLRILRDEGLFSAPITHFDNDITAFVTSEWQGCGRVLHNAFGKINDEDFRQCGDMILCARIRTLADEGVFEMKGDGVRQNNSFVRLPPSRIR